MLAFMTVRELYELVQAQNQMEMDSLEYVQLQGWVRTNRDNGSIGFIELNDGTYFRNCQLVYTKELADYDKGSHFLSSGYDGFMQELSSSSTSYIPNFDYTGVDKKD